MFVQPPEDDNGLVSLNDDIRHLCDVNDIKIFNVSELTDKDINAIDALLESQSLTTYTKLADEPLVAFAAKNIKTGHYVGCVIANDLTEVTCNIDVIGATQKGVGSLLMLALLDHLQNFGLKSCYLYAAKREGDSSARTFYEKIGFKHVQQTIKMESSKFIGTIPLPKRNEIIEGMKKYTTSLLRK